MARRWCRQLLVERLHECLLDQLKAGRFALLPHDDKEFIPLPDIPKSRLASHSRSGGKPSEPVGEPAGRPRPRIEGRHSRRECLVVNGRAWRRYELPSTSAAPSDPFAVLLSSQSTPRADASPPLSRRGWDAQTRLILRCLRRTETPPDSSNEAAPTENHEFPTFRGGR